MQSKWNTVEIMKNIKELQILILWDYNINGSLIMYNDNEIKWDMDVSFILNEGEIEFFNFISKKGIKI